MTHDKKGDGISQELLEGKTVAAFLGIERREKRIELGDELNGIRGIGALFGDDKGHGDLSLRAPGNCLSRNPHPNPPPEYQGRGREERRGRLIVYFGIVSFTSSLTSFSATVTDTPMIGGVRPNSFFMMKGSA